MTRDELFAKLHEILPEAQATDAMEWVDDYVTDLMEEPPEAWTAVQVAQHIGAKDSAAARSTMSRWGIKSIAFQDHPTSGRQQALYPAERIIEEHNRRKSR